MRRLLPILALLVLVGGCNRPHTSRPFESLAVVLPAVEIATTTTTLTTAPPEHRSIPRASRTENLGTRNPLPTVTDGGFWRRVANCECASGHCGGAFLGYFQFSADTARKVGWFAGASYDEQVGMAQRWLALIGGRGGSRSGWPVCWWRALRGSA